MKPLPNRERLAPWAVLVVISTLVAASAFLVHDHLAGDLALTRAAAGKELQLLASRLQVDLQEGNYQYVDQALAEWGRANPDVVTLSATAANGFVFGSYRRGTPAERTLTLDTTVSYSYRSEARIALTKDLAAAYHSRNLFAAQLAAGLLILTLLLALLTYTLHLRQREAAALRQRTAELDRSNRALSEEIDQRRRAEEALFEAKERAEVTLHSIGDAVITTDARGAVEYLNPIAEQLTGWSLAEAAGRSLADIFPIANEVTREPVANPVERVLREGVTVGLANHTVLLARDGREIAIEDSAAPIRNRDGRIIGVVMVFHDVTQSRKLAHQLSWQASHDALTGLVNRREFETRLQRALESARTDDGQHALLYLDLDQFKVVNDTCGHVAGDELLRQLSKVKEDLLRGSDTLARLGGDEFGVLLEHCPLDQAARIAEVLRQATQDFRFAWEDRVFEIGVSIGVVPVTAGSGSIGSVLSAADMACYAAKEAGRNRVHVYRESDSDMLQRRGEMLWVNRLTDAINQHRFVLFRQAIVPLRGPANGTHYEVLLRLRGDDGELIGPGMFLPAAERYSLMAAIDRWVVQQVLAREALQPCCPPGSECLIAINLSGASLGDERLLEFVHDEMKRQPEIARRLCFEITETAAIANLARAATFMRELRTLGCRFALDDFGTGLSSFAYLKNLPVDFLKIDGSLVKGIVDSRTDLAMVSAINEIGHTLGIRTIAEFVENDAIRAQLADIGVDYAQGYGVGYPEPFPP